MRFPVYPGGIRDSTTQATPNYTVVLTIGTSMRRSNLLVPSFQPGK